MASTKEGTARKCIPILSHKARATFNVFCVFVMVILVALICLMTLWSTIWVGSGLLAYPRDGVTLQEWTNGIAATAQRATQLTVAAALSIAVVALITVIAAWRRNRAWLVGGLISGVMLSVALALASTQGLVAVHAVIAETNERIGQVNLVPDGTKVHIPEQTPPILSLTQTEAETEITRLIEISSKHSSQQLIATDPATAKDGSIDSSAPPFEIASCYPDPDGDVGNQTSITFKLPSDVEGAVVRALAAAWSDAGYPAEDQIRSQLLMYPKGVPIHRASINDSFTIDGMLHVHIESACATGAAP